MIESLFWAWIVLSRYHAGSLVEASGIAFTSWTAMILQSGARLPAGHVFQLEDRSIEKLAVIPEFSEIFWPPNAAYSTSANLDVYV